MAKDFTADPVGITAFLKTMQAPLAALAGKVVNEAQRSGPRNPRHAHHEVDAITVGAFRVTADGAEQDIDWRSPYWHFIEYGSVNQPPLRVLTRAAQNHGLTIKDRGTH